MKRFPLLFLAALVFLGLSSPSQLSCQLSEEVLRARIEEAQKNSSPDYLLWAAEAARLLRDFELADTLLIKAEQALGPNGSGVLFQRLSLAFASGTGVEGAQKALKRAYAGAEIPPQQLANWVRNFPGLLMGGEFDEVIEKFSPDAEDQDYRCECFREKAWMHWAAGRREEGRIHWAKAAALMDEMGSVSEDPDMVADFEGQRARDHARAGHEEVARALLEKAIAMPVTDGAQARVRRRWAQAYAELGEVEKAVEHLDYLLSIPSLITVHSLESRLAWAEVLDHPAFQELLARYR